MDNIFLKTSPLKPLKLSKSKLIVIRDIMDAAHTSYEADLKKKASYKIHNIETNNDLVQETFLKTLLYLQKGGKIIVMKSFLNHILNDLIIDDYRKNKTMSLDNLLGKGFEPSFDDRERTMNIFDGKIIILLLPLLPEKYQIVVSMRYLQDLSLKEISLITGQSQNTVAVQAHRGLEKLKTLYKESTY